MSLSKDKSSVYYLEWYIGVVMVVGGGGGRGDGGGRNNGEKKGRE